MALDVLDTEIVGVSRVPEVLKNYTGDIAHDWFRQQLSCGVRPELLEETPLRQSSREFLEILVAATQTGNLYNIYDDTWQPVRDYLATIAEQRCAQGFSPWETATFVFALRPTLYGHLQSELGQDSPRLLSELDLVSTLLEQLGLWMMEVFQRNQADLAEQAHQAAAQAAVSRANPIVPLWQGVVAILLGQPLSLPQLQDRQAALLAHVAAHPTQAVIFDCSEIRDLEPEVMAELAQVLKVVRLLGIRPCLSGIHIELAPSLAQSPIDLQQVMVQTNLKSALAMLLPELGWQVQAVNPTLHWG